MKHLRRLYFKLFKRYERLEMKCFTYKEADDILKKNDSQPEENKWHIAIEEDTNYNYGVVFLERKKRIME